MPNLTRWSLLELFWFHQNVSFDQCQSCHTLTTLNNVLHVFVPGLFPSSPTDHIQTAPAISAMLPPRSVLSSTPSSTTQAFDRNGGPIECHWPMEKEKARAQRHHEERTWRSTFIHATRLQFLYMLRVLGHCVQPRETSVKIRCIGARSISRI